MILTDDGGWSGKAWGPSVICGCRATGRKCDVGMRFLGMLLLRSSHIIHPHPLPPFPIMTREVAYEENQTPSWTPISGGVTGGAATNATQLFGAHLVAVLYRSFAVASKQAKRAILAPCQLAPGRKHWRLVLALAEDSRHWCLVNHDLRHA